MNSADKLASNQLYSRRMERYGVDVRTLASGTPERRVIRFSVLADVGDLNGASVLDLGCGLGDFYEYLCSRGIRPQYTGYDVFPDFVQRAAVRFPGVQFEVRDIQLDGIPRQFDYVISSQVFNRRLDHDDNFEMVKDALRRCFAAARKGVVCDFLTSYVDFREDHLYYYSPEEMLRYCKMLTKRVLLRHDYPLFEFAVYLYPDFPSWNAIKEA
jgi:SAM-dependent methyltransferase